MDQAPAGKPRFRISLRGLLLFTAICGVALYLRPGQMDPRELQLGTSQTYVRWFCGPPDDTGITKEYWIYGETWITFSEDGKVISIDDEQPYIVD